MKRTLPKALSPHQIDRLYAGASELLPIIDFAYSTGARVSEIVRVQWGDIDFERATVRLYGKKRERMVPIARRCLTLLSAQRNGQGPNERVFPITTQQARDRLAALGRRLGLPFRLHPHQFRHAYASVLHQHGADVMEIAKLLGHEDVGTTDLYLGKLGDNEERLRWSIGHCLPRYARQVSLFRDPAKMEDMPPSEEERRLPYTAAFQRD